MGGLYERSASRRGGRVALSAVMIATLVVAMVPATAFGGWWRYAEPELVSVTPAGEPGDERSENPAISDDGQVVAFDSWASDLSPDDNALRDGDWDPSWGEGSRDIFVRDMSGSTVDLVTLTPEDTDDPQGGSRNPSISDDGRYIAFYTGRSFVPEDTNGGRDLYVYDRESGEFTFGDFWDGEYGEPWIDDIMMSGDGTYVAFSYWYDIPEIEENGRADVYLWEWAADELTWVSETPEAMADSDRGARLLGVSDDGQRVAFLTGRGFVGDDENGERDIYLRDFEADEYIMADLGNEDGLGGWYEDDIYSFQLSGNGEFLVFQTEYALSEDDVNADGSGRGKDIYRWNVDANEIEWVSEPREDGSESMRGSRDPVISDDGRYVAFFSGKDFVEDDTNGEQDVYLRDMDTGAFTRVILTADGSSPGDEVSDLAMSGNGAWLAFSWEQAEFGPKMGAAYTDPSATGVSAAVKYNEYGQVYVVNVGVGFDPGASRLAGADRYATAVAVSQEAFPFGSDTVVVATGGNWPDALCASSLAGVVVAPVLLTKPGSLPEVVADEIERLGAKHAYVVGGTTAVEEVIEDELNDMLDGYVFRLSGDDRYGTSRAIANRVINIAGGTYSGMAAVTTGGNYPDALAAAPLGAGLDWPILLVKPATGAVYIPADTFDVVILGGTAAIPSAVETSLKADLGGSHVVRVGGATRYDTAAKVAQFGVDNGLLWNGVGIASGTNYPDALAGGTAVGLQRSVMLLTTPDKLDDYTKTALTANKAEIATVRFFGGTSALSSAVETAVKTALGM